MTRETKIKTPVYVDYKGAYAFMHEADGSCFIEFFTGEDVMEERTAYIVKAVNNHEALAKLARELLICLRDEDDTFDLKYEARKILASLEKPDV